jgi:Mg-chelatase subunit ChlD
MALELSWSKKRQVTIVTIIFLISVILFGSIGYALFNQPPSCMDKKKNQNETGVDCGGVCSRICMADTKSLTVDWVRLFKIREGIYSVVAKVDNPAANSIAEDVPYTFSLKDSAGQVVATRSGTVFIPSRSTFVVFEGTISSDDNPTSVAFQFDEEPQWTRSDYLQPELNILDKQLTDLDGTPRLVASIQNPNIVDVKNITLSSLIYDDQGNAVQVSQTYVEKIEAGQTVNATFTWPQPISLKSRICESPVDVALVIDRSGSMQFLGENPPQPMTDVKEAAQSFVRELSKFDQGAIISFANEATAPLDAPLTSDLRSLRDAIGAISIIQPWNTQNTNLGDGIQKAMDELGTSRARADSGKIIIALTDGVATRPEKKGDAKYPESFALAVAKQAKEKGSRVFTIGLGKDLNQEFLKQVATSPEDFYLAPTADQLEAVYREIGTKMCKRLPTALEIVPSIPL